MRLVGVSGLGKVLLLIAAGFAVAAAPEPGVRRNAIVEWWRDLFTKKTAAEMTPEEQAERADWELASRVRGLLHRDRELAAYNFAVQAKDGVVTLSGPVPSGYFKARAGDLTHRVRGVKGVHNDLRIRDTPPDPDPPPVRFPPIDQPTLPASPLGKPVVRAQDQPDPPPRAALAPPNLVKPKWEPATTQPRLGTPVSETGVTPPAALAGRPLTKPNHADGLSFRLERLRASNPQFAQVEFTVSNGVVEVTGMVTRASDRDDLIAALEVMPGVARVISKDLAIRGR